MQFPVAETPALKSSGCVSCNSTAYVAPMREPGSEDLQRNHERLGRFRFMFTILYSLFANSNEISGGRIPFFC